MKTTGHASIHALATAAADNPRRRANLNLHASLEDPYQRFFNAIQPGSYVRVHRHADPPRWEAFVAISGRAAVLELGDDGTVLSRVELSPQGPDVAIEIPASTWHTVCALEPDTVLFEIKPGPYSPPADKDFAPWAPPENEPSARLIADWYATARPGDRPAVV